MTDSPLADTSHELFARTPNPTRTRTADSVNELFADTPDKPRRNKPRPARRRDDELILRPGDIVAAGLHGHACPTGRVTAVTDHGFRLNLYDQHGTPTAAVAVVMWTQVVRFGPVITSGEARSVEPLCMFRAGWESNR